MLGCCLFVPEHDGPSRPVLELSHVCPRDLDEAEAGVVPLQGVQADQPGGHAGAVGSVEPVPEQLGPEPATLQGWGDGQGGEVPGRAAAGGRQELGFEGGEGAVEDGDVVGGEGGDGEEGVVEGEEGGDEAAEEEGWEGCERGGRGRRGGATM